MFKTQSKKLSVLLHWISNPKYKIEEKISKSYWSSSKVVCFGQTTGSNLEHWHVQYSDVIMSEMASQITGISIVCLTLCSAADQRKHQSSASLAFVRGIHWWPLDSPYKQSVMQKIFSFWWHHHEHSTGHYLASNSSPPNYYLNQCLYFHHEELQLTKHKQIPKLFSVQKIYSKLPYVWSSIWKMTCHLFDIKPLEINADWLKLDHN